ncbi:MAG: DUF1905 domain-containing protein [Bdellovibrionales bacterium]
MKKPRSKKSEVLQEYKYSFQGKIWKHKSPSGWHFVTLPKELSKKIRNVHLASEEGWGRLKTCASIKSTKWETAIWFDSKLGC